MGKSDFSFHYPRVCPQKLLISARGGYEKECEEPENRHGLILTEYVNLMNGIGKQWRTKEISNQLMGKTVLQHVNASDFLISLRGSEWKTFVLMAPHQMDQWTIENCLHFRHD